EPANYKRIHKIMFVKDYVRYLLTGGWQTDHIDAQGTLLFDVENNRWSEQLCKLIDLPIEVLPPICNPTDIVGHVTEQASQATGLRAGTPVVCGTSDSAVEDYAAGAIHPGQCIIKLASAGNLNVMTASPVPHPRTLTYSHVIPGMWYSVTATNAAASAMRWFRDSFCQEEIIQSRETGVGVYRLMEEKMKAVPAGSEGLFFSSLPFGRAFTLLGSKPAGKFHGGIHGAWQRAFHQGRYGRGCLFAERLFPDN
ncbi:MAG: xylulokinase, partial [Chitinophagaceae bacterium]|nr:xylulokinase [Chitinophagaceae bacterium]